MRVDSIKRNNAGATRGGQLEEGAAVGEGAGQVPLSTLTGKEAQKQGRLRNCMQQYAHTLIIQSSSWYSPRAYASGGWRRGEGG